MASWRPLGGLLGDLGVVLAALRAPVNDLDASGALLAASGELLDRSWRSPKLSWWSLGELLSWRPMVCPKGS